MSTTAQDQRVAAQHRPDSCHYCTRFLCHDCVELWSDCRCDDETEEDS